MNGVVTVKRRGALVSKLGIGKPGVYEAIVSACDDVLSGAADGAFAVDALQGGAGTSTNMNVN